MVKGISRRVIVVESPDPHIFEQAIFILSNDAAGGGVSSQQVVEQAVRIAKSYARTHGAPPRRRRLTTWMAALLGAVSSACCGWCWPSSEGRRFQCFIHFFSSLGADS